MKRCILLIGILLHGLIVFGQQLDSLLIQEQAKTFLERNAAQLKLAWYYSKKGIPVKSLEYWSKIIEGEKKEFGKPKSLTEFGYAEMLYQVKQYNEAIFIYDSILPKLRDAKDSAHLFSAWINLIECHEKVGNTQEALNQYIQLNKVFRLNKSSIPYITQLNHKGILELKNGNITTAIDHLIHARDIVSIKFDTLTRSLHREILINLATAFSITKEYFIALQQISLTDKLTPIRSTERATIANWKGAIYLLMKRYEDVTREATLAINLVKQGEVNLSSLLILADSYQLLAKLYQGRDQEKFIANQFQLDAVQENISKLRTAAQALEYKQLVEAEKIETAIKDKFNLEQRELNWARQSQLEKDFIKSNLSMKEQELIIVKQNEKLQLTLLDREIFSRKQTEQQLFIDKQELNNNIQKNKLIQQNLIQEKQQQELRLASSEKDILNKQLELESNRLQFTRYVTVLIGVIFILSLIVIINLLRNRSMLRRLVAEKTKQLLKVNEKLSKNNEQLEQYSYMTAHNLRGTVARIIGLSSIMKLMSPQEQITIVSKITDEANMLDTLIKDMNQILQINKGTELGIENLAIVDSLNRVKQILKEEISNTRATIDSTLTYPSLKFIPTYFDNILYNLVGNAIKYRHPDRPPIITITTRQNGFKILEITDNGLGVDLEKNKDQIFGLYKRFHSGLDGKGIGLYMVKTQIESIGGKIEIQSTVNVGTRFTLYFPDDQLN